MCDVFQGQGSDELSGLQVWLLDMAPTQDGLLVLGATINTEVSNNVHFAIGAYNSVYMFYCKSLILSEFSVFDLNANIRCTYVHVSCNIVGIGQSLD